MSLSATLHLISILVRAVLSPSVPLKGKHHSDLHKNTHIYTYGVKLGSCSFLHDLRTGWGMERGVCGGRWKNGIKVCNVKTDVGPQSCLFWTGLKGRINIWVRCIKQRFSVGVSTLQRGFQFQWLGGCAQTETKSPRTFLLLGSEHFQMCHSVDVNELVHLTRTLKWGTEETIFHCSQLLRWKLAHQVGKLQVIAEAIESSLVLVERLK